MSATTERARAFVADHKDEAAALGRDAGELVGNPADLVVELRAGLERLADPEYREGMDRVAPGIGPILGVRQPLLRAVGQGLRAATRRDRSSTVLDVAEHLLRADLLELHWLAFGLLERTIREDPERTWQLVAGGGPPADNWITVDYARPRRGARDPGRALPLGGAGAARLLAVALGAPPRRVHDRRHPDDGPPPRSRRRRSPGTASGSCATSSATPSPTSRRRSRGRCAR